MKVDIWNRRMELKLRLPTAGEAAEAIASYAESPPDGYKWYESRLSRRGRSGRAVNVTLVFVHCDENVDPFANDFEAKAFFEEEEAKRRETARVLSSIDQEAVGAC